MNKEIIEGRDILIEEINRDREVVLVTMEEPYDLIKDRVRVKSVVFNRDMTVENLENLSRQRLEGDIIYGFGGGTSCDTAKYLGMKNGLKVVIAPSVVSVDAWLCRSIAVRFDYKVRYIGDINPSRFIVDYAILEKGPEFLNKAGVGDVLSITTALGDWNIAKRNFGDRFDISYYNAAYNIAKNLLLKEKEISNLSEEGLKAIVRGQLEEVLLCEDWGNSRPEEGGEHFLAYCLEEITHKHYIHGLLIALNIVIVLKLQRENAVFDYREIYRFFRSIGLDISLRSQDISEYELRKALINVPSYVKRENLYNGIFSLKNIYDERGEYSIDEIVEWASTL